MPPPHHRSKSPRGRHHSRSRSPGRSKSPHHHKHHHKHHGRSKSPKHHHKHHHHRHGSDSSGSSHSHSHHEDEVERVEEDMSNMKVASDAPAEAEAQAEPTRMSEPVAAVAAPVMGSSEPDKVDEPEEVEADEEAEAETPQGQAKPKFFMSKMYGGEGGDEFDHMNRRRIDKIVVRGGKWIDGISVTYGNGDTLNHGGDGGDEHVLNLDQGEYVNMVRLKEGGMVLAISFFTNKGNKLGPVGSGKGRGIGVFAKEGTGVEVKAPEGYRLIGIRGREGKYLDAIGFRWGPVPN